MSCRHLSIRFVPPTAERHAEGRGGRPHFTGKRVEGAEVSEKPACGRRLGWVRLAADTREETGQGQGEPLPGAGCIRETGIKPPPIKVVSAAGTLRPLGAAGALGPATSRAAEKVRGPEDKLPAFQGCSLLRPRGRHSHRLPLARRSPVGGEAAGTGVDRALTAPWSRSHCPLPGGLGHSLGLPPPQSCPPRSWPPRPAPWV